MSLDELLSSDIITASGGLQYKVLPPVVKALGTWLRRTLFFSLHDKIEALRYAIKMKSKPPLSVSYLGVDNPLKINWFPGHMAKAIRQVMEKLKMADLILEVRDARAPLISTNEDLIQKLGAKKRIILLNKANLASPENLKAWKQWFEKQDTPFFFVNALDRPNLKMLPKKASELLAQRTEKFKRKGIRPPAARLMILGLPNTGKSTLINGLANRKATKTGARPGVTQRQDWVIVDKGLELLDTPGIMPPKIKTFAQGLALTAIHCIKDDIPTPRKVALFLLQLFAEQRPEALVERYQLEDLEPEQALEDLALKMGFLKKNGLTDHHQAASRFLKDFRDGKLGTIIFEEPPLED